MIGNRDDTFLGSAYICKLMHESHYNIFFFNFLNIVFLSIKAHFVNSCCICLCIRFVAVYCITTCSECLSNRGHKIWEKTVVFFSHICHFNDVTSPGQGYLENKLYVLTDIFLLILFFISLSLSCSAFLFKILVLIFTCELWIVWSILCDGKVCGQWEGSIPDRRNFWLFVW